MRTISLNTDLASFLAGTVSQHGFLLMHYHEVIEPQVTSLIEMYGESTALELINTTDSQASASLLQTIRAVKAAVFETEWNANHPDDYYNAGGFFAHWEQYTAEEKLEFISQALKD